MTGRPAWAEPGVERLKSLIRSVLGLPEQTSVLMEDGYDKYAGYEIAAIQCPTGPLAVPAGSLQGLYLSRQSVLDLHILSAARGVVLAHADVEDPPDYYGYRGRLLAASAFVTASHSRIVIAHPSSPLRSADTWQRELLREFRMVSTVRTVPGHFPAETYEYVRAAFGRKLVGRTVVFEEVRNGDTS